MKKFRIEALKERNEWFNSLTPAEKRVEVAKDVLVSLKSGEFSLGLGYLSMEFNAAIAPGSNMQCVIEENEMTQCVGCAIAAIFYSRIALGNGVRNDLYHDNSNSLYFGREEIHEKFKDIFSENELEKIEVAYERCGLYGSSLALNVRYNYIMWGENKYALFASQNIDERVEFLEVKGYPLHLGINSHDYAQFRLILAIMENIIKNKGRFRV